MKNDLISLKAPSSAGKEVRAIHARTALKREKREKANPSERLEKGPLQEISEKRRTTWQDVGGEEGQAKEERVERGETFL